MPKPLKEYKYKSVFDATFIKASVDKAQDKYLSKASLEDLKKLGVDTAIDLDRNMDLLGVVFNGAVVNRLNKNDDGVDTKLALAIIDKFVHKPLNLAHNTSKIVGHVINTGWSRFGTNEVLSNEDVKDMKEPFNMAFGGVVYYLVDEEFSLLLVESSDESHKNFQKVSASWEIYFDEYELVVGSRNFNEAEIISDPKQILEYKKHLRAYGGSGKLPDGRIIGRKIAGDEKEIVPVGFGFTSKPAAEVQGVKIVNDAYNNEGDGDKNESNAEQHYTNSTKNISQNKKIDVKDSIDKVNTMKFKNMEELMAAISDKKEISTASVQEFIEAEIGKAAKEFSNKQNESKEKLEAAEQHAKKLEQDLAKTNEQVTEMSKNLQNLQNQAIAKQQDEDFQARMSSIASEFALSDKDNEIIAKEIKGLSEEDYKKWFERFSSIAESKKKSVIESNEKAIAEKVREEVEKAKKEFSKASVQETEEEQKKKKELEEKEKAVAAAKAITIAGSEKDKLPNNTKVDEDASNIFKDAFKIV